MQSPGIEPSLRSCRNRCEAEYDQHVSTHAVVFVNSLGIIHASVDAWSVVLGYSHDSLDSEEDVRNESQDAVWGGEVEGTMGKFVVLDYDECGEEGENGGAVDDGVYVSADPFLFRGMCRLED